MEQVTMKIPPHKDYEHDFYEYERHRWRCRTAFMALVVSALYRGGGLSLGMRLGFWEVFCWKNWSE
jgi:hypothetical protein